MVRQAMASFRLVLYVKPGQQLNSERDGPRVLESQHL